MSDSSLDDAVNIRDIDSQQELRVFGSRVQRKQVISLLRGIQLKLATVEIEFGVDDQSFHLGGIHHAAPNASM